jgi:hypothetical protein
VAVAIALAARRALVATAAQRLRQFLLEHGLDRLQHPPA